MEAETYKNQFRGTAKYYAKYKPKYDQIVWDYLKGKFNLNGSGRLLDLGCGTGQIVVPLSKYFEKIVAMDPEVEMLEEAKIRAREENAENINFVRGGSYSLDENLGSFRLVAMGRSFNWMDRDETLKKLYKIIEPGGGIAAIAERDWVWNGGYEWQVSVRNVVRKWLPDVETRRGSPKETHEEVIARSVFKNMEIYQHRFSRLWNTETVIGYLYSTSYCSIPVLGDKKEPFERDMRNMLENLQKEHKFVEDVTLQVITAWKE